MAAADPGRPWWASAEGTDRLGDDDPLAAHRAGRAGTGEPADHDGDPGARPGGAARDGEGERDDDGPGGDSAPPWWIDAAELVTRFAREAGRAASGYAEATRDQAVDDARPGGDPHVHTGSAQACQVCPLCAGIRILAEARPEMVGHLTEAARHLTLAARAFLDVQAEVLRRDDAFEHIRLDEE